MRSIDYYFDITKEKWDNFNTIIEESASLPICIDEITDAPLGEIINMKIEPVFTQLFPIPVIELYQYRLVISIQPMSSMRQIEVEF